MTADFDISRHYTRLLDAVALADELLDPEQDLEEIRAEYDDARRCRDADLHRHTDREAAARELTAAKIASCYSLLRSAGQQGSEELSASAADELRRVVLADFRRRGGDSLPDKQP